MLIDRIRRLGRGVEKIEDLREHLQVALELEHATIPPYLCALYSIHDGANAEAARIIRSVVVEEMLHMTLVANLLNAIGGEPDLLHADFTPRYPAVLPHSDGDFEVGLGMFSPETIQTFLKIERPARRDEGPVVDRFHAIGQFYAAIAAGFKTLCAGNRHFTAHRSRQITRDHYYGSGGELLEVTNLETALQAIHEIVEQGEGFDERSPGSTVHQLGGGRLGHYFRYKELQLGRRYQRGDTEEGGPTGAPIRVDWDAVYPMRRNPKIADYRDPDLRKKAQQFNAAYRSLLATVQDAFRGRPERLMEGVGAMCQLKYEAVELMRIPLADGTAGPTFEVDPTLAYAASGV